MPRSAPVISRSESISYNLRHVLPYYLRGIFTRNHFWYRLWSQYHPDPLGLRFIARLRQKYQSDYLYLYMLTTKSLLVLDRAGIRHVLDHSPAIYADAKLKRQGMSHFQPHAVTISRGEEWVERRKFNEEVLQSGHGVHGDAEAFHAVIRAEMAAPAFGKSSLNWDDFAALFERITLQIIFGKGNLPTPITEDLTRMMRESNRVVGLRPSRYFDDFYQRIRQFLANPSEHSLAHGASAAPATAQTHVENQLVHWLFAMKDTLAENVVPALALIVSHPDAEARVRQEMASVDLATAEGIAALRYLEACIEEAMRLWPTTPMLARESVVDDSLEGIAITKGTQVLILNSFTHRDVLINSDANRFDPQLWLDEQGNEPGHDDSLRPDSLRFAYNHLSNGPQVCAGKDLALFIAKSVLATLLNSGHYRLHRPRLSTSGDLPQTFNPFLAQFQRDEMAAVG